MTDTSSLFGQRILLLIPHPDDEVVGFATSIARARALGARVYALYLSHGCLARQTLWFWQRSTYDERVRIRSEEAKKAADYLGLNIIGTNTQRAAREIWPQLETVKKEMDEAIQKCAPDRIWVPAYEGGNPDHDALNALASLYKDAVPVFEGAEYHFARGHIASNTFFAPIGTETLILLTPEEQQMKRAALALYASEQNNLGAIRATQEMLRPLPTYDYAKPPHAGKLGYERFQWVPFKHPRVDYTKSAQVCDAIQAFLT